MVAFCRTLTFACATEITAKLASSTVLSRSRCAATSSWARTRSSSTSTRYGRSSGDAMVRLTVVTTASSGWTMR